NAVRGVGNGPVLLALATDVLNGPPGDADWSLPPSRLRRSMADPVDVERIAAPLCGASRPVIRAGQGVLYSEASSQLVALAEAIGAPVATTLNGKIAFPEHHPLALGT